MNQQFEFQKTAIDGVIEIFPFHADDIRGGFTKDFSREVFAKNGIDYKIAEIFYAENQKGVIRGLHFQREKQQPKLVRCISGHIWDVIVDLRKNSPTFKRWLAFDLYGKRYNEVLAPKGCAHGYLALEPSIVSYKCAEKFYGEYDDGIRWNDPDIAVRWPLEKIGGPENVITSDKDQNLQTFAEFMAKYGGF